MSCTCLVVNPELEWATSVVPKRIASIFLSSLRASDLSDYVVLIPYMHNVPSAIKVTVCCPGPIATGTKDQPRVIFGTEGILRDSAVQTGVPGGRMAVDRAVELISRAVKHDLPVSWIVGHPLLLMGTI